MSAGQIVGGVVGAVIGFYVGGPAGAFQGAVLGAGVGGYLDPPPGPTVSGPRLNDLKVQTSTYGAFIPRVYGVVGISGNIMALENNQLKEKARKKTQGGKGGGSSTTVKTYTYSATFLLGLCEGPIVGVRRIWCADKLIYNAGSDDIATLMASNQAQRAWKVYLGTDDQMPDPRYEAEHGVGNVSAFRGMAYIAFYDFELADYSNTLQAAQFKVEIVASGDYIGPRNSYTANLLTTLNETVPRSKIKGNVFSFWYDPADPRPWVGRSYNWWRRDYRVEDGSFISEQYDPQIIGPDTFIPGYERYDLGRSIGMSWVYDADVTGTPKSYVRGTNQLSNRTYQPYPGESNQIGVAAYDNALWIFRLRADGTRYVEKYTSPDITPSETFEILSPAIGPVWCQSFGSGLSAIIDADEQTLFLLDCGGPDIRVCPLVDGVFTYSATITNSISYNSIAGAASDGVLVNFAISSMDVKLYASKITIDPPVLSEIIRSEANLASLISESDFEVDDLTSSVDGYVISGGTIRSALEPLQGAYPFDIVPSGYKLKGVPRGQAASATVPWQDLGATDVQSVVDSLMQSREMDSQLPARTSIKYLDAAREYAVSEQYSERLNTEAVNRVDRELPLVLPADKAASVAEVLNYLPWLERTDLSFTLPPSYLAVEPADVLTLQMQNANYSVRITEANYTPEGRIECKAKPNNAALYLSNATGSEGVPPSGEIPLVGNSYFIPLDIPVVDESVQNSSGFVGVLGGYSETWLGGILYRSPDAGQTWRDIQGFIGQPSAGYVTGTLAASSCALIDERSLNVRMLSGELESITRDQMLAGNHYAAYGIDGRWEIVRYQNAVLQPDGSYVVSGFCRGERGTEWATGLHASGDYFVVLDDPDNIFISMASDSIAVDSTYRAITSGQVIETGADVAFTYQGVNLKCLSPVYAKGTRDGSSNFTGTFIRRSRLSSSWWITGVVAPVGEATEAYEVDVMSGSTVKRTISVNSPTFTYSAANQVTDFGSAQASITFRIYQLSATVGRGYPLEATL